MTQLPTGSRRTLADQFATVRGRGGIGLLPFLPAGYPDLETTAATLLELDAAGATAIEVGFPFSDPIADGPVIQQAFTHALSEGVRVGDVLDAVRGVRANVAAPLLAMVSYSIVYRLGGERFFSATREAGFDGLILPDLPPPEAQAICQRVREAGLDTVLMVAPSTAAARRCEIVRLCSGFVYYLSVSGTTGERDQLPADLEPNVMQLRELTQIPICVGFGISRRDHLAALRGVVDGAIVGSALVRHMQKHGNEKPTTIARSAGEFCRLLLS